MKRIAIVYDTPGWCQHQHAVGLANAGSRLGHYVIDIYSSEEWSKFGIAGRGRLYDAALVMSWQEGSEEGPARVVTMVAHYGIEHEWTGPIPRGTVTPAIGATRQRNRTEACGRLPKFSGVVALTPHLASVVEWCGVPKENVICLPCGVDTKSYYPYPLSSHRNDGKFRIGWCGQIEEDRDSIKGYQWVLLPLIEKMRSVHGVQWDIRAIGPHDDSRMSWDRMRDWYNTLDLFLVTSIREGCPAPAREAMACGVPVVGTRVGDLPAIERIDKASHSATLAANLCDEYSDAEGAERTIGCLRHLITWDSIAIDDRWWQTKRIAARSLIVEHRDWWASGLAERWLEFIVGE